MFGTQIDASIVSRPALWRWGLWFAVLSGLGQTALVVIGRMTTNRLIRISPDVVWMAPFANSLIFGVAVVLLSALRPRLGPSRTVVFASWVFLFLLLIGPLLMVPRLHPFAILILGGGLAAQGARMIRARVEALDRLIRRTLLILASGCFALGVGVHVKDALFVRRAEAALPPAAANAPNVILIVMDTVRAQSLSLYGYQRQTSPHLTEFARTGVVFDRAIAPAPWTLPSHASFFTGRLPHELSADWLRSLDDAHTTLAETLSSKGYATVAFVANLLYATAETGLNRGFIRYSDFPLSAGRLIQESWLARGLIAPLRRFTGDPDSLVRKRASDVNDEFADWIASRPDKPFFAFLNYFDAHAPYTPPAPFDTQFIIAGQPTDSSGRTPLEPEIQNTINDYDGALAYMDAQFGQLLEILRSHRLLDNTLIIVTSDHGEQFGEHGLYDHANSLYRQLLQVPLVIAFPPRVPKGLHVSEPVTLVDLPATILDVANASTGDITLPGHSLADYWNSPHAAMQNRPVFSEVSKGINLAPWQPVSKGPMRSVVVGGMHYILNGDGREELYDFDHDAAEVENLANRVDANVALEKVRLILESH